MARDWNRRDVVRTGLAAGLGTLGAVSEAGANGEVTTTAGRGESLPSHGSRANRRQGARPVAVSSSNGLEAVKLAVDQVNAGVDTLDAVIAGVNIVERDPNDTSVGFGGLPNEEGVVQLDSSCMHGPSRRSGAVAAIEGVKTPSNIAQLVAYRTDHVLLVGEGASRFANAHGYGPENLLTERAREIWLRWKENVSDTDDWLAPEQEHEVAGAGFEPFVRDYGTINCNIVDADGNISGVTTTSGLSFKIPGRSGRLADHRCRSVRRQRHWRLRLDWTRRGEPGGLLLVSDRRVDAAGLPPEGRRDRGSRARRPQDSRASPRSTSRSAELQPAVLLPQQGR